MEKKYILTKKQLIDLLKSSIELSYLESGGVDNWEWYGEHYEELENDGFDDFEDAAEDELKNYEEYK